MKIATIGIEKLWPSALLKADIMKSLQGLIALRPHIPNSRRQAVLRQRWRKLKTAHMVNVSLNAFGMYAYDSILMIAHSINAYMNQGGKISFAEHSMPSSAGGNDSELGRRSTVTKHNTTNLLGRHCRSCIARQKQGLDKFYF